MGRFATMVLMLTVIGCSDSPTQQEQPTQTTVPHLFARTVRVDSAGHTFHGDAYFGRIPEKNLVFIALDSDGDGRGPDRIIDQVYVLQSEAFLPAVPTARIIGATLVNARSSVLVREPMPGGTAIRFTVAGKEPVISAGAAPMEWSGYGLSRRVGQWPMVEGAPLAEALKSALTSCSGSSEVRLLSICDSGGTGSTACSTSCGSNGSCSVSCGAGYFSCCRSESCSCTCVNSVAPDPGQG